MSAIQAVVILSGGLDSSVLLASVLHGGGHAVALSVNYGQRHVRELECAAKVAEKLGVEHVVVNLSDLHKIMSGSSQTDSSVPVPHGHYEEETMKATVVPNRNMVLLACAGALAISRKLGAVAYGAHAGDHAIYPDCREEFIIPMAEALCKADYEPVALLRPFLFKTKADIAKLGAEICPDILPLTYSCYEGGEVHCGKCGTCVERREAFQLAGVEDPTAYKL